MMAIVASALPQNTGDGYVAAAYIVFFVLLLVYVAIMAIRLGHVQREVRDLQARTQESARGQEIGPGSGEDTRGREGQTLEREPA